MRLADIDGKTFKIPAANGRFHEEQTLAKTSRHVRIAGKVVIGCIAEPKREIFARSVGEGVIFFSLRSPVAQRPGQ